VCRSLTVKQRDGGQAVTTEAIRSVPVTTLVRGVGARCWKVIDSVDALGMTASDRRLDEQTAERFRREGPTDEALGWVGRSYRMALVLGDPPTRAVENALELPRSTAGRWVAAARRQGFLGAAEGKGKAGG
jgi:hypothetical protein